MSKTGGEVVRRSCDDVCIVVEATIEREIMVSWMVTVAVGVVVCT